ncbi:MAG: hypothetical protein QW507_02745 [Candidatus Nanoarchaeia archaeon]|nr:hypothetical protein [Candidatus Haiyanarchaeum thermophilum]MCW1303321.1 hypothetical protein [Candidatus Haiyanarchaeum thermophilum]MCW1304097.1 hypothetical protein [Candidatus Haiyanarchaeum thermophilum]MCW1306480.1 hypothetical protein [Candidatus Haiyanarchaeum thermophilum]MCW1307223.1 hypothetical protein [Candidatus Haiyanarchaeum thermophilum]
MRALAVWISYLLYFAVSVVVIGLVLAAGIPMITRAREVAIVTSAKNQLQKMAEAIVSVSGSAAGTAAEYSFKVDEGILTISSERDVIYFQKEIGLGIIAPRTIVREGYLIISSEVDTSGYETSDAPNCCYILENSHLLVKFYKFQEELKDDNNVIKEIWLKDLNRKLNFSGLNILVDDDERSTKGVITTFLEIGGSLIPKATLIERVNSSTVYGGVGYCYDVRYSLESTTDFIIVEVINLTKC